MFDHYFHSALHMRLVLLFHFFQLENLRHRKDKHFLLTRKLASEPQSKCKPICGKIGLADV